MAESNFVVKNGLVVNGSFVANGSVVNAAAVTATSLTTTGNVINIGTTLYTTSSGNVGIGTSTPNTKLSVSGTVTITGGIVANGSIGTNGHVLHSNGSGMYWAVDDQGVTSISAGAGLTGGNITSTGTLSILANTGIIANASGTYVNGAYIATIVVNTANNASYLGGVQSSSYALLSNPAFTGTVGADNITITGNLGIGTAVPDYKVSIQTADAAISFKDVSGVTRGYIGIGGLSGSAPAGAMRFRSDQGGFVFVQSGGDVVSIAESGTVSVVGAIQSNTLSINAGYGSTAPIFGVRAWAAYNGGAQSLIGSGNISSVDRFGTGTYRFNFTTAMPDGNYSVTVGLGDASGTGNERARIVTRATSYVDIVTYLTGDTQGDVDYLAITVVR